MTVVVAGAIVAIIATGSGGGHGNTDSAIGSQRHSGPSRNSVATAASYLGKTRAQLRRELRSGRSLEQIAAATGRSRPGLVDVLLAGRTAQLQALVKAGRLSDAAMNERLATLRKRLEVQVSRIPGYVGLPASARYLGLSMTKLESELQAGHSLAQIADATPGKSASGLIDARVNARASAIESTATSGRIAPATERRLLWTLRARVTSEVERASSR